MAVATGTALALGGLVGAGASIYGAKTAANSNERAARIAADASRFQPWNVYSGYGSGTMSMGPGGNTASATLSPEYQAIRDKYLDIGSKNASALGSYNPEDMAGMLYGKLRDVSAFQRSQDRNAFENRLYSQGMLGLNQDGENPLMGSYLRAEKQADLQREIGAYGMSQDFADQLLARSTGATSAATSVDALPMQNLDLGGMLGGRQSDASRFGADAQFRATVGSNAAYANLWGNLGNKIGDHVGQYLTRDDTIFSSSPFSRKDPISPEQAGMLARYYGYQ